LQLLRFAAAARALQAQPQRAMMISCRDSTTSRDRGDLLELNVRAVALCDRLLEDCAALGIAACASAGGCRLVDCGIVAAGGLEAGRRLAEICLAGLGRVEFVPAASELGAPLAVSVAADRPVVGCMASQYAGWRIAAGKFFAMGSGPMRAAAGGEALFDAIGHRERPEAAVGVLETREFPPDEVCRDVARQCGVAPQKLTLLLAPTASLAGTVQVVARSVETAMHKLLELGFDLGRVASGFGTAPLPPAAADDLAAIGRTNDAILYGGEVTLWVRGDDRSLEAVGPQVPSCASSDFGRPFAAIFERYNRDFYAIDRHLFSPAVVTFANLDTGRTFRYGHTRPDVIRDSFAIQQGRTDVPGQPDAS
jgi:methenyltetrahydromethanopterin cyclohydrolase